MQLVQYNPFRDMDRFEQNLDKLWQSRWGMLPGMSSSALDMYEEDGKLIAEISLPNFNKDEVKVTAEEGELEISASHHEKKEDTKKRRYFFREMSSQFMRRINLPAGADTKKIEAHFKDGTLKVVMPLNKQQSTIDVPVT